MTHLFDPCRKYREDLCAVMSGDLPAGSHTGLENHLKACADCQRYRDEIGSVTALLTAGRDIVPDVELGEAAQMRWTREFEAAVGPIKSSRGRSQHLSVFRGVLDWSREMVWPCGRIWAGLAAIWIVILGLNASSRVKEEAQASHRPSPELIRALLASEGFLPVSGRSAKDRQVEPPRAPSPQPRSEQHRDSSPS